MLKFRIGKHDDLQCYISLSEVQNIQSIFKQRCYVLWHVFRQHLSSSECCRVSSFVMVLNDSTIHLSQVPLKCTTVCCDMVPCIKLTYSCCKTPVFANSHMTGTDMASCYFYHFTVYSCIYMHQFSLSEKSENLRYKGSAYSYMHFNRIWQRANAGP